MANRAQGSQYPPLFRQGSLHDNLTFHEVQSQLGNTGKPLHSMNLDELLKSVISSENGQLVQNHSAFSSDSFGNIGLNGTSLSNKPINEVWREIAHQEHGNTSVDSHLQQSSLGGTTLEEFLARAGVINNVGNQDNVVADTKPLIAVDPMVMASEQDNWLSVQMQMQMQVPSIHVHRQQHQELLLQQNHQQIIGMCPDFSDSKPAFENPVMEIGYSGNPLGISMPVEKMSSSTCSDSKGAVVGRKRRFTDEMLEKTIERRQKRMAKNRESAAKSRAKKQAYIEKLENDKSCLLKSNRWLKKLKDAEGQLLSATALTPKYQLRRTSSNTF